MRTKLSPSLIGLLGLMSITACGDDDDDSAAAVQDANAEVCEDLAAHASAVGDLAGLDPSTATKDDYESAVDEVSSSREDLVASAEDLSEAEWDNLEEQVETLGDQLRDAPDDQAVAAILDDAQEQVTAVRASIATLDTAVCGAGGGAATTAG